ncbi:MAG: DUF3592 domain-containing protein [Anaerolineales bacterium]|nr:MAG: DUF3592 domain-containing protein [Anaerolineales bacterium]
MGQEIRQPSPLRIIQSDYVALLAALFPIVSWVMYVATAYFGFFPGLRGRDPLTGADAPFFLYLGIITTLIGIPLLVWRIRSFQAMFTRGVEVPGRITNISFYRDRGRVEYAYTYQGQTYQGGNAVRKTGRTKALQPGGEVVLIVDRDNPKRALIRDLYV